MKYINYAIAFSLCLTVASVPAFADEPKPNQVVQSFLELTADTSLNDTQISFMISDADYVLTEPKADTMMIDTSLPIQSKHLHWMRGVVIRIVDGDTFRMLVRTPFHNYKIITVRLKGVDTPETYGEPKDSEEYKAGMEAKRYVANQISNDMVYVKPYKKGGFGRWLVEIYKPGQSDTLNDLLIKKDLASPYEP